MQDVSGKLLVIAHVLSVVQNDQVTARVLIKDTLELFRCVLDVLFPLCLEELQALACDNFWVLLLQIFHCSNALLEGWV